MFLYIFVLLFHRASSPWKKVRLPLLPSRCPLLSLSYRSLALQVPERICSYLVTHRQESQPGTEPWQLFWAQAGASFKYLPKFLIQRRIQRPNRPIAICLLSGSSVACLLPFLESTSTSFHFFEAMQSQDCYTCR